MGMERDALKRSAAVAELSDSDGEAAETDHLQKKKMEGAWKSERKRAEEEN